MNNSNENQEVSQNSENCGTVELPKELKDFKKICNSRCSICRSSILKELHEMRKDGMKFDRIVEVALERHGVKVSASSLSRHFKNYVSFKVEMATQIIKHDAIEEITAQSVHIKRTVELLDLAYDSLLAKFKSGTYSVDISDLEKLTKMRYQILNGENTDEADLVAVFQKATNKYGLDLQQGVLFNT